MNVIYWDIGVDTAIEPSMPLPSVPEILPQSIVILTGRAPIWRYGMAFHAIHGLASVVAVYDPRLGNGVVVASHNPKYKTGDLVA